MKNLLLVSHCPSPNTEKIANHLIAGANDPQIDELQLLQLSPFATQPEQVISSHGIILFTTENFGYMSGALKDMFDRIYYPCLDKTQGMP